jgi:hypothetical protein
MNNMKETAVRFGKLLLEQRHALWAVSVTYTECFP